MKKRCLVLSILAGNTSASSGYCRGAARSGAGPGLARAEIEGNRFSLHALDHAEAQSGDDVDRERSAGNRTDPDSYGIRIQCSGRFAFRQLLCRIAADPEQRKSPPAERMEEHASGTPRRDLSSHLDTRHRKKNPLRILSQSLLPL